MQGCGNGIRNEYYNIIAVTKLRSAAPRPPTHAASSLLIQHSLWYWIWDIANVRFGCSLCIIDSILFPNRSWLLHLWVQDVEAVWLLFGCTLTSSCFQRPTMVQNSQRQVRVLKLTSPNNCTGCCHVNLNKCNTPSCRKSPCLPPFKGRGGHLHSRLYSHPPPQSRSWPIKFSSLTPWPHRKSGLDPWLSSINHAHRLLESLRPFLAAPDSYVDRLTSSKISPWLLDLTLTPVAGGSTVAYVVFPPLAFSAVDMVQTWEGACKNNYVRCT